MDETIIRTPPRGLAVLAFVGPSFIWCAEYIGSGEVILATRTGAILGSGILWAVIVGIFLKYWIGLSGARYTVCTGEGMIDMFDRMPGPRHWVVWLVLVVQFAAAIIAIAGLANAAGIFFAGFLGAQSRAAQIICGWSVSIFAIIVVFSGKFETLKIIMSIFVFIIVVGTLYVAVRIFPPFSDFLHSLVPNIPVVPQWAVEKGVSDNPWKEILPLIGWGAGGFASQVWYTYWVLGAGYGATAGRGDGKSADLDMLKNMTRSTAEKIKFWCHVLYTDATLAMLIGIVATGAFLIAGAGILAPLHLAPKGADVAVTLSNVFAANWGKIGSVLFMLAGAAALIATQIGQLAGWPRLLADSTRICFPSAANKFSWKTRYRFFLVVFFFTSMVIIYTVGYQPVLLVKIGSICDGLLLTPLQALCVLLGLFFVMPKLLSKEAAKVLKPNPVFAIGLVVAFIVFTIFIYFGFVILLK
ncbi:MAG: Nramp family divalent metal transporter [Phycisphaerae bacterium]|nr:Nramp family divalent metal transporter [Phycisphaerae bacterium]